jgi:hypothetical protein
MFFYRDKHKGKDDCVKDFWSGCVVVPRLLGRGYWRI